MMRHLVVVYVQGMFPLLDLHIMGMYVWCLVCDLFSSTHHVAMVFSMCIS